MFLYEEEIHSKQSSLLQQEEEEDRRLKTEDDRKLKMDDKDRGGLMTFKIYNSELSRHLPSLLNLESHIGDSFLKVLSHQPTLSNKTVCQERA